MTPDASRTGVPVSVVMPTYNRRARLARVLEGLAAQRDDDVFEVVVVSDGSTDGTDDDLRDGRTAMPVIAVFQPNAGPAQARNSGVAAASGELVLFIDDDVVPEPGLIQAHLDAHRRRSDEIVVIGPMLTPPDAAMTSWVLWEQQMLEKQYALLADLPRAHYRNFYTGNASMSRQRLLEVGCFDTRYRRAEDVELAYRLGQAGLEFIFEPQARAMHYAERSFASWLSNAYEYGRNDVIFARNGQVGTLDAIRYNLRSRHALQRAVVRACAPRPRLGIVACELLRRLALGADRLKLDTVTRQALSGLYGIRYHQGVVDELGDSAQTHQVLHGRRRIVDPVS